MPYANHRRCVKIVACSLNGLFWVTGTLFVGVAAWSVATGSQVSLVDQQRFVSHSASNAGFAALEGEILKCMKYDTQVFSSGALFFPLAVESFGTWTDVSLSTLKTIASKPVSVSFYSF
ncbi:uncharacterized protein LOC134185017 isoform X1 [Corticium candelabrum]|uniref:uncharacterized protein LOC134185017 isoform X1 n=1 Tax=Corticium candelabrum TaxID=121492 RepID=UPI002E37ED5F|nr:uncharacterized protein LOC134185017 isoform X1 [Corticium candelabrum]